MSLLIYFIQGASVLSGLNAQEERVDQKTEKKRHRKKKQLHLNHTLECCRFPQHLPCVPLGCISGWWEGIHPSLEEGIGWQDREEAKPLHWWVPQSGECHTETSITTWNSCSSSLGLTSGLNSVFWVTILYHDQTWSWGDCRTAESLMPFLRTKLFLRNVF